MIIHLVSFFLIGTFIKFADQAFDEGLCSKKAIFYFTPIIGILLSILILSDSNCALLLLSITIGCFFSGKIDNIVFQILSFFVLVSLFLGITGNIIMIDSKLVAILSLLAFIDEIGNNWADRSNNSNKTFLRIFFLFRFTLKIGILIAAISRRLLFIYFPIFIMFDIGYIIADLLPKISPKIYSRISLSNKSY